MTDGKRGGTMTSYNDKFDFEIGATEVQNKINEYVYSKMKNLFLHLKHTYARYMS